MPNGLLKRFNPYELPKADRESIVGEGFTPPRAKAVGVEDVKAPQASTRFLKDMNKYEPQQMIVPASGSVAKQLTGLLSSGSKYIQGARQRGRRGAARRGLVSSSISEGAAEQAAIQAALPIAQQDAASNLQVALANQQAVNNSALAKLGYRMQAGQALSLADQDAAARALMQKQSLNAQIGAQLSLADLDVGSKLMMQKIQSQTQFSLADLDSATKLMGIQMDNDSKLRLNQMIETNKRALQSDASISTAFSNTMNSIGQVYQNPEMSAEQQRAAASYFMSSFRSYVQFQDVTGGSNYSKQFNWGSFDAAAPHDDVNYSAIARGGSRSNDLLAPFGTRGASNGEVRVFGDKVYEWNGYKGKWDVQKARTREPGRHRAS